MAKKVSFTEKQRVSQWWIWLLVGMIDLVFIYAFIQQIIYGIDFGNHPINDSGLIIVLILIIILNFMLFSFGIKTRITSKTIYFKFFPFHLSYRCYHREKIKKAEVIKYNPIRDLGGWGIKTSLDRNKKAFNISGKYGLSLELQNGKTIIIGTKKPEEISKILNI